MKKRKHANCNTITLARLLQLRQLLYSRHSTLSDATLATLLAARLSYSTLGTLRATLLTLQPSTHNRPSRTVFIRMVNKHGHVSSKYTPACLTSPHTPNTRCSTPPPKSGGSSVEMSSFVDLWPRVIPAIFLHHLTSPWWPCAARRSSGRPSWDAQYCGFATVQSESHC